MLKSLSLRYDPEQDRLLLLLETTSPDGAGQTHALHLTRRVCAAWRKDLQVVVDLSAQAPSGLQPVLRAAVSKAHHDAQASQAPVRTEKAPAPMTPADSIPRLVLRVLCGRNRSSGRWVLEFQLEGGSQLRLQLNTQTLHGLVDALSRRVRAAQWDLPELPVEKNAPEVLAPPGGTPLH